MMYDVFVDIFRRMAVAEAEISAAAEKGGRVWRDAFHACYSPVEMPERLYRAHCREQIARVEREEATTPATWAEVAGVLYNLSLDKPLGPAETAAYLIAITRSAVDDEARSLASTLLEGIGRVHVEEAEIALERVKRKLGAIARPDGRCGDEN